MKRRGGLLTYTENPPMLNRCCYFPGEGNPRAENQRRSGITSECICVRYREKREGQITPSGTGKQTAQVQSVHIQQLSTAFFKVFLHFMYCSEAVPCQNLDRKCSHRYYPEKALTG